MKNTSIEILRSAGFTLEEAKNELRAGAQIWTDPADMAKEWGTTVDAIRAFREPDLMITEYEEREYGIQIVH